MFGFSRSNNVWSTDSSSRVLRHLVSPHVLHKDESSSSNPLFFCKGPYCTTSIPFCFLSISAAELSLLLPRTCCSPTPQNNSSLGFPFLTRTYHRPTVSVKYVVFAYLSSYQSLLVDNPPLRTSLVLVLPEHSFWIYSPALPALIEVMEK